MTSDGQIMELVEYQSTRFEPSPQMDVVMETLWEQHSNVLEIQFPSRKTDQYWEVKPGGVAGQIELHDGTIVWIRPKCSIESVLRMIFAAYRGDSVFDERYLNFQRQPRVIDLIASEFIRLVQMRMRQGLYQSYEQIEERLYNLRGRICFHKFVKRHWDTRVDCQYHLITADNAYNQILLCALEKLVTSRGLAELTIEQGRRIKRKLSQQVSGQFFRMEQLEKHDYNRVNDDYRLLHQLAGYFIGNTHPGDNPGASPSRSYLIDMSGLFEDSMVALCRKQSPANVRFAPHVKRIDLHSGLEFRMDMVVFQDNSPVAVVDAKYKTSSLPTTNDIQQVVAYAESLRVRHAFLVYPTARIQPVDLNIGDIHVKSLVFDISTPLDGSSQLLVDSMVENIAKYVQRA